VLVVLALGLYFYAFYQECCYCILHKILHVVLEYLLVHLAQRMFLEYQYFISHWRLRSDVMKYNMVSPLAEIG